MGHLLTTTASIIQFLWDIEDNKFYVEVEEVGKDRIPFIKDEELSRILHDFLYYKNKPCWNVIRELREVGFEVHIRGYGKVPWLRSTIKTKKGYIVFK